jgi:hypothetical protein
MPGLLAFVVATGTTFAYAIEPAKHTVDWYQAHPQARDSVLATCQNDHSFDDSGDCRNAQSASHAAAADSPTPASTGEPEADPAYYGRDGSLIALTLAACTHHQAPASWCKAAHTASANLRK